MDFACVRISAGGENAIRRGEFNKREAAARAPIAKQR